MPATEQSGHHRFRDARRKRRRDRRIGGVPACRQDLGAGRRSCRMTGGNPRLDADSLP
jgi:hypothetical protein